MLREDDLAYIDYYSRGESELYDLRQDPYQLRSIPAEASARAASDRDRSGSEVTALRNTAGWQLRALEM